MNFKKPELLAPAGDSEAFCAALDAGADSIYIGLKLLNARALAKNFTPQEAAYLIELAHKKGKKVFIAMNSLVKEAELKDAVRALAQIEAMQADALIIQDLGLFNLAQQHFPNLRLHASTLMTIHNSFGVKQAHHMGFKRVVLAREMTLKEIESAVKAAPVEIEVFIHGAMCFCYSGLCLFSSFMGGRSSTRGKCVQPCRRKYKWGNSQGSFFSMNDLEAGPLVWDLAQLGVTSLKIEGRLRPANYVHHVVKGYRLLLDSPVGDKEALEKAKEHFKLALGRPSSKGFFLNARPRNLVAPRQTANTGLLVGKIVHIAQESFDIALKDIPLAQGDRLRIVNKNDEQCSLRVTKAELNKKDNTITIFHKLDPKFKKGLVFKTDVARDKKALATFDIKSSKSFKWNKKKIAKVLDSLTYGKKNLKRGEQAPQLWVRLSRPRDINFLKKGLFKKFFIKISQKNIRSFSSLPKSIKDQIVWYLDPIQHENEAWQIYKLISQLYKMGARAFEISNLGQLEIIKKAQRSSKSSKRGMITLYSSYHLNCLNSFSLGQAVKMGIKVPQFSIETDLSNAKLALANFHASPVSFTIFAYPVLFRSRLSLSEHRSSAQLLSPKKEATIWHSGQSGGFLISPVPYNGLRLQHQLAEAGFSAFMIDLTGCSNRTKNLKDITKRQGNKLFLPRGKDFNLTKGLS